MVEVLAAIVILTIAIIPMVTMFDVGLRSATTSGNYDQARSLANMKLEEAKSLPYDSTSARDVKDNFPENPPTTTSYSSGSYQSSWRPETGFSGLEYRVQKQFLNTPSNNASQSFSTRTSDDGMLRVVVTVRWGSGNTYSATGLVSR